jgi:dienelactone hydrolase
MDYELARRPEPWLILFTGVMWFAVGAEAGMVTLVFAAIPGAFLVAAAVGTLFYPGERGIMRFGATGAVVGLLFTLPMFLHGAVSAVFLGLLSAVAGISAARLTHEDLEPPEGHETPEMDLRLAAEIALDESVLGGLSTVMGVYSEPIQQRVGKELDATLDWLRANGWLNEPAGFHEDPPPIGPASVGSGRSAGVEFEVMRFESEFEPRSGAPGRERWMRYANNRTAEVRLVRAPRSRDWLVCVHGLAMGRDWLDMYALSARRLHSHGVNLAFPVLPLHGPRAVKRMASGAGFVTGDVCNTLHALTQTVWDLRRLIGWLRDEGAERVGVMGLSLGGYSSALLASLEDDLECVIAGIPATGFGELACYHASARALWLALDADITPERIDTALTPVSPLELAPRIPRDRRFIFGALADRFVPPRRVQALWQHWEEPEILWYPGGHLGFRFHPPVRDFVDRALRDTLLRDR